MSSKWMPGSRDESRDSWYRELTIRFQDGSEEHFYIELTQTGTHIPKPIGEPAKWVKLNYQQCSCCPLSTKHTRYCPAAESMETTLLRLQDHYSHERVKARATDAANRETVVEQSLQEVGTSFVHLAVFSSGCPIGREFRPMLNDLRPFSTNEELSKHLVSKTLLKHRGSIDASREEILSKLEPLREVFSQLCKRLPVDSKGDAMTNAIICLDAATMSIVLDLDEALDTLAEEMGWKTPPRTAGADRPTPAKNAPPPPKSTPRTTWWSKLRKLLSRA